jgi:hypothetical protein
MLDSFPQHLKRFFDNGREFIKTDVDFCSDVAYLARKARGWDKDDKRDGALEIERALVADAIYHELQRRLNEPVSTEAKD